MSMTFARFEPLAGGKGAYSFVTSDHGKALDEVRLRHDWVDAFDPIFGNPERCGAAVRSPSGGLIGVVYVHPIEVV